MCRDPLDANRAQRGDGQAECRHGARNLAKRQQTRDIGHARRHPGQGRFDNRQALCVEYRDGRTRGTALILEADIDATQCMHRGQIVAGVHVCDEGLLDGAAGGCLPGPVMGDDGPAVTYGRPDMRCGMHALAVGGFAVAFHEIAHDVDGFGADVVLDTLGVLARGGFGDAQRAQKTQYDDMTISRFGSDLLAVVG